MSKEWHIGRSQENNKPKVLFTSNALIKKLSTHLETSEPCWDEIANYIHETGFLDKTGSCYDRIHLPGIFAEIYLHMELANLSQEFSDQVFVDPILDSSESSQFLFRFIKSRFYAILKKNGNEHAEYDGIAKIGGITTVFETKITRPYFVGNPPDEISKAISNKRIKQLFVPLLSLNGSDSPISYIVVTTEDAINPQIFIEQKNFIEKGGRFIRLPMSSKKFKQKTYDVSDDYQLLRISPH